MLCGSLSSPQFGHSWNLVAFSAWWLRRMFRFDGEVFLLGTAIAAPSTQMTSIKMATICASSAGQAPRRRPDRREPPPLQRNRLLLQGSRRRTPRGFGVNVLRTRHHPAAGAAHEDEAVIAISEQVDAAAHEQ